LNIMCKKKIFDKLREDIINYDDASIAVDVEKALTEGTAPLDVLNVLSDTMKDVGDKFSRLELFLTNLVMAGDTMKIALSVLLPKISKKDIPVKGKVLIGTVKDDIHDIGKNIVIALLTASGFEVVDLGKDVRTSRFIEEAEKNAADIVALSALMSTTMPTMKDIVDCFTAKGLRSKYKIIVGGGPVTKQYAEEIGADGYAENAVEAVKLVENLTQKATIS